MPPTSSLLGFALISLGCADARPNMIYLISRSITQGARPASSRSAASRSASCSTCCARRSASPRCCSPCLTPMTRCASPARPICSGWHGRRSSRAAARRSSVKKLAVDSPRKLFAMGFVTNLLNPKIAMLYLALLPQFIDPAAGSVLQQSLMLGAIQIVDQRQRQRDDRARRRIDRAVPRHASELDAAAALSDGHGARRAGGADGIRGAEGVTLTFGSCMRPAQARGIPVQFDESDCSSDLLTGIADYGSCRSPSAAVRQCARSIQLRLHAALHGGARHQLCRTSA